MPEAALPEVAIRHKKQLAVMRGWLEGRRYFKAMDALEFVRGLERGTRKDGETPKFHHQLSIARLISTLIPHLIYPEETLAVAFLHDTREDHHEQVTHDVLFDKFGSLVADAVWLLTKKCGGLVKSPETYYKAIAGCPIASIVKPGDRAHNLQTMDGVFTPEKQLRYVAEVEAHYWDLIRTARRLFPRQYGAYENLKILLRCQTRLIRRIHEA